VATHQAHIYSIGDPFRAEQIRQMLSYHEIPAFILNKQDSAYKFGDIELYVHRDHAIRAKILIREFEER